MFEAYLSRRNARPDPMFPDDNKGFDRAADPRRAGVTALAGSK